MIGPSSSRGESENEEERDVVERLDGKIWVEPLPSSSWGGNAGLVAGPTDTMGHDGVDEDKEAFFSPRFMSGGRSDTVLLPYFCAFLRRWCRDDRPDGAAGFFPGT
jgi:hypothetical protein